MSGHATGYPRGIAFAGGTAVVSGVAIFLNARGVRAAGDAAVYTTAKNLVAAAILALAVAPAAMSRLRSMRRGDRTPPLTRNVVAGMLAIAVIGGSVPFVLFFEGLARESSGHAAFLQKTLVVWVAVLALPLLGERSGIVQAGAIALLITGQAVADGGLSGFRFGTGELLILAATLLWSAEVIVARRLLPQVPPLVLGAGRLSLGATVLLLWILASGRWSALAGLDRSGWWWAAVTGMVLAVYVAGWFTALSLAPAVDVTAVLSLGALVTAALSAADTGALPSAAEAGGLAILLAGTALLVAAAVRARGHAPGGAAS
ncbi:DMT family transporter [Actinomadura bangladeshensis]|uniref:DMT family transporter n=1 Tax=Actinomadura bangladeshensis TaxID=453573 RepID=A0A4R4P5Q1_9ACTN|nr:DMT family transporter [Actinomadura bangladeshensis]TDC16143.1 DMT family transporter [Actinomadura bangladeshensis]